MRLKLWGSKGAVPGISPTLMSESGTDEHIRLLKDDLDSIGAKARAALRSARAETMTILAERVPK